MHLLDTDVVIWHLRNKSEIVALVESLSQAGRLGMSVLTRLEVGVGVVSKNIAQAGTRYGPVLSVIAIRRANEIHQDAGHGQ